MGETKDFSLVGHYHFATKDKTKEYFIVQVIAISENLSTNDLKANIINIFTTKEIYEYISNLELYENVSVSIIPNLETNKISYKINV